MLILNPPFLQNTPSQKAQWAILLALLWVALPLTLALPPLVMMVFALLWVLRGAMLHFQVTHLPRMLLFILLAGVVALVWFSVGSVLGREGGVALLLLLVLLKAFEGSAQRDWQVLLLALLFVMGASVLLNASPLMGAWLLGGLLVVCVCFALLCELSLPTAWRRSMLALLLTLPLMVVLFLGVPRLSEPLWRIPQIQQGKATSGLSDSMQPGSISQLVQTNELVANVVFADGFKPQPQDLYWRAIVMVNFDGHRWRAVDNHLVDDAQVPVQSPHRVYYQMIVRDQHGALPALDYPLSPLPKGLSTRLGDIVRADLSREGLRRLDLQASLSNLLPHSLSRAEVVLYTQLPNTGNAQTRALAERLWQNSGNDVQRFVNQVLQYYRQQHFQYTLQPLPTRGSDGIDAFMFRTHQGFCEHYAQSFVVMMRAAGIPARVVTGYLGGEYHSAGGGFWQVRSRDAHAWAEVWLPQARAWWRVDPTAAVAATRQSAGISQALPERERSHVENTNGAWSRWQETGQFYWQQWVVNYDQNRQNSLFSKLGLSGFNWRTMLLVLPIALLLAVLPLLRWWAKVRHADRDELQEGFMLLKTVLLGAENEKLAATSASELCQLLHENKMDNDIQLMALLEQYERWLYADGVPSKRERRRWLNQARRVAKRYYQADE